MLLTGLSRTGRERLATVDPLLADIVSEVAQIFPLMVVCGHRSKEEQDRAYVEGKSKLRWPNSKHNSYPSQAVDLAPLVLGDDGKGTILWNDNYAFGCLAGYVLRTAQLRGVAVRWGADWDLDFNTSEHRFVDGPHFELVT